MKRKANDDDHSLSEQQPKRCRKQTSRHLSTHQVEKGLDEDSVSGSKANTRARLGHPNKVAKLKAMLQGLITRKDIILDDEGRDSQRDAYGFKLRAFLRLRSDGRWACPAPSCTHSYTRKCNMTDHVIDSSQADHQIPKVIFENTECSHCRDKALDEFRKKQVQDRKRFQSDPTDQPKVVGGRKEKPQASIPAIGPDFQEYYEREIITQEEQAIMSPKVREQAHRLVENLSKSIRSDTDDISRSGNEPETSGIADPLYKDGDHTKQRCSIAVSSPSPQASIKDRGRSFPFPIDSEGTLAVTSDVPANYVISKRSDGETEAISNPPAAQCRGRFGADTHHQSTRVLDFYDPRSPDIMQQRHLTSKSTYITAHDTQVPPYPFSVSRENMPDFEELLRLSRHYRPEFYPERQADRINATESSPLGWEPVQYSGYGASDHRQYWASAGASSFANQSLGQICAITTQGFPNDNINDPLYSNRSIQPDRSQPPFYQLS